MSQTSRRVTVRDTRSSFKGSVTGSVRSGASSVLKSSYSDVQGQPRNVHDIRTNKDHEADTLIIQNSSDIMESHYETIRRPPLVRRTSETIIETTTLRSISTPKNIEAVKQRIRTRKMAELTSVKHVIPKRLKTQFSNKVLQSRIRPLIEPNKIPKPENTRFGRERNFASVNRQKSQSPTRTAIAHINSRTVAPTPKSAASKDKTPSESKSKYPKSAIQENLGDSIKKHYQEHLKMERLTKNSIIEQQKRIKSELASLAQSQKAVLKENLAKSRRANQNNRAANRNPQPKVSESRKIVSNNIVRNIDRQKTKYSADIRTPVHVDAKNENSSIGDFDPEISFGAFSSLNSVDLESEDSFIKKYKARKSFDSEKPISGFLEPVVNSIPVENKEIVVPTPIKKRDSDPLNMVNLFAKRAIERNSTERLELLRNPIENKTLKVEQVELESQSFDTISSISNVKEQKNAEESVPTIVSKNETISAVSKNDVQKKGKNQYSAYRYQKGIPIKIVVKPEIDISYVHPNHPKSENVLSNDAYQLLIRIERLHKQLEMLNESLKKKELEWGKLMKQSDTVKDGFLKIHTTESDEDFESNLEEAAIDYPKSQLAKINNYFRTPNYTPNYQSGNIRDIMNNSNSFARRNYAYDRRIKELIASPDSSTLDSGDSELNSISGMDKHSPLSIITIRYRC